MLKPHEPKKRRKRGLLSFIQTTTKPVRTYSVGVYFPERDPLTFYVKAHDFILTPDGVADFFCYVPNGMKDFSAHFTHVAWVLLQEETKSELEGLMEDSKYTSII